MCKKLYYSQNINSHEKILIFFQCHVSGELSHVCLLFLLYLAATPHREQAVRGQGGQSILPWLVTHVIAFDTVADCCFHDSYATHRIPRVPSGSLGIILASAHPGTTCSTLQRKLGISSLSAACTATLTLERLRLLPKVLSQKEEAEQPNG